MPDQNLNIRIDLHAPDLERTAMLIRLITILAVGGLLIATALAFA